MVKIENEVLKRLIDKDGYFIEDVYTSDVNKYLIEEPIIGGFYKPKWNGKKWIEGDIEAHNNNIKKTLIKKLKSLLIEKRKDLKDYISGMNIDIEQEEAFNFKYQLALAVKQDDDNAKNELQTEADIRGLDVEDLADLIIEKHDKWINILQSFNQKIEVFRIKMNELINNNEFNKAKEVLEQANNLGISTSYEDILNLFK